MQELINFALESSYGGYVLSLCLLCRVFITVAPVTLTERVNDTVMMIVSALALASNKVADNKGNKIK